MVGETIPVEAVSRLRRTLEASKSDKGFVETASAKDDVLKRYQPLFSVEHLDVLTPEQFLSFLEFKNNQHWLALARTGPMITVNMGNLQQALRVLQDRSLEPGARLDRASELVRGAGKAILTALLHVLNPEECGVWNNVSQSGLVEVGLWPEFVRGESMGQKYERINAVLVALARELQIDLWTLDEVWWMLLKPSAEEGTPVPQEDAGLAFGLEPHLQRFMRDNWDRLELGKQWAIYAEPGEQLAGYEYACALGRMDLLCKHRSEPRWLILELKRGQKTEDETLGQLLRYMGWVKHHLASPQDSVEGCIITDSGLEGKALDRLQHALSVVPKTQLRMYDVTFSLHDVPFAVT